MKVNWDTVEETGKRKVLPPGEYLSYVKEIKIGTTKNGDVSWNLMLEVVEGEHETAKFYDNIFFSKAAMNRVKLVFSRFGVKTEGEMEVAPEMLMKRNAIVTLGVEDYEDKQGVPRQRNVVPFDGYSVAPDSVADDSRAGMNSSKMPPEDAHTIVPKRGF